MKSTNKTNIALAVGTLIVSSATLTTSATEMDLFSATDLVAGYQLTAGEGKCGEGKCGNDKTRNDTAKKSHEGKCGEGKCGGDKATKEGKCGEGKCGSSTNKTQEGKCGEGKCGSM